MLLLARKLNEAIVIGWTGQQSRDLRNTVLEVKNGVVRLGFEGDPSVLIHRLEVWHRIHGDHAVDGPVNVIRTTDLS